MAVISTLMSAVDPWVNLRCDHVNQLYPYMNGTKPKHVFGSQRRATGGAMRVTALRDVAKCLPRERRTGEDLEYMRHILPHLRNSTHVRTTCWSRTHTLSVDFAPCALILACSSSASSSSVSCDLPVVTLEERASQSPTSDNAPDVNDDRRCDTRKAAKDGRHERVLD